jgi:Caspase domain
VSSVYALLVGIQDYEPPVNPLQGCRTDVEDALTFLQARVATQLREEKILDKAATRQAVTDGLRDHLGQAGADDVGLFWFSGHGSQQPVAEEFWHLEPTGLNQTLVCADSRRGGVPDLADKELSALIDRVTAAGAHTLVVLDCCFSGGGTRDPFVSYRGIDQARDAPPAAAYVRELREAPPASVVPHVALAACRSDEKAKEQRIDGQMRGVFSSALLAALQTLGAGATYRDALVAAKCKVENAANDQVPVLYPLEAGGIADRPFLGGAVERPLAAFVLRYRGESWEIDGGRCHGIPEPSGDDTTVLSVPAGEGDGSVRVTYVRPELSLVEPVDWQPDTQRQYPVVIASLPLPPAAVVVGGLPGDDAAAARLVVEAVESAGPDGSPSPHVRVVPPEDHSTGLRLRVSPVRRNGEGAFQILRGDTSPATADVEGLTEESARTVVSRLEHIARWTLIKELDNPGSSLAGKVAIEIVAAEQGEATAPRDRPALVPDEHGEYRLSYERTPSAWEPPKIFVRLRNTADRQLWCVLLDLTDRYRVHSNLFEGGFIAAGEVGAAYDGDPIEVTLPPGRELRPGAVGRDWFKLLVAEGEFGALAFDLPRLDEPATRSVEPFQPKGILDRLGLRATTRDVDRAPGPAGDWTTSIVSLVTVVPEH